SDFLGAFQVPAFAFPFPAVPTLSEVLSRSDRPFISDSSGEGFAEFCDPGEADSFSPLPSGR
ncbi:hypothetical protein ACFW33_36780, partial [Streptomyces sp. NPDC058830]|uniref:hypothetical protein n=1 Tax=unclassified Streptomyces TaxID=2593676 RepID=UPI0036A65DFD